MFGTDNSSLLSASGDFPGGKYRVARLVPVLLTCPSWRAWRRGSTSSSVESFSPLAISLIANPVGFSLSSTYLTARSRTSCTESEALRSNFFDLPTLVFGAAFSVFLLVASEPPSGLVDFLSFPLPVNAESS